MRGELILIIETHVTSIVIRGKSTIETHSHIATRGLGLLRTHCSEQSCDCNQYSNNFFHIHQFLVLPC